MFDYLYDISTVRLAIYCVGFFIGLMWLGIIFVKPFLRTLIGRQPGINDLVFHTTSGFSLYYGLLLDLLTVAVYQNLKEVRQNVSQEAANLASLYRDSSFYPDPAGAKLRELLRDYTLYVIYKGWPAHRQDKIYQDGTNRLKVIEHTMLQFHPEGTNEEILHSQTLQEFRDFAKSRQARLSGSGWRSPEFCGMSSPSGR